MLTQPPNHPTYPTPPRSNCLHNTHRNINIKYENHEWEDENNEIFFLLVFLLEDTLKFRSTIFITKLCHASCWLVSPGTNLYSKDFTDQWYDVNTPHQMAAFNVKTRPSPYDANKHLSEWCRRQLLTINLFCLMHSQMSKASSRLG